MQEDTSYVSFIQLWITLDPLVHPLINSPLKVFWSLGCFLQYFPSPPPLPDFPDIEAFDPVSPIFDPNTPFCPPYCLKPGNVCPKEMMEFYGLYGSLSVEERNMEIVTMINNRS